jgi:hypothetical protein
VSSPEEMWSRFIELLEKRQPLGHTEMQKVPGSKKKVQVYIPSPHKNFLGSIESHRKIFMEANNEST